MSVPASGSGTPPPPWPAWAWVAVVLAGIGLLVLAGLFPEADPPDWLPGGMDKLIIREFLVEAPAKAHEARNWALFGEWHRNPADNYQFWRSQAPVWVYPLAVAFKLFGVSYTTLRWFSLGIAMAGFVGVAVLVRRVAPAWAGVAAIWLYATNAFVVVVARSGLIEVLLNTLAAWLVFALILARRHPGWLVLSQVLFTAAYFGKQGIIYLFPLLVITNVAVFVGWRRQGAFPRMRWLPVLTAVGFAIVAAVLIAQPEYQRTLGWNWSHLVSGIDRSDGVFWWHRFDVQRIWRSMMLLTPVVGVLGLPGALWLAVTAWHERRLSWSDGIVLGWMASAWLAILVSRGWMLRTNSILLMPTLVVAAMVAWRLASIPRARLAVIIAIIGAVGLGTNLSHQTRMFEGLSWDLRNVAQRIEQHVGDEPAVFMGRFAMPILLSSKYDIYYVKGPFNTTPEQLDALAPTHILLSGEEGTQKILRRIRPSYLRGRKILAARVDGLAVSVSELPHADPKVAIPPPGMVEPVTEARGSAASEQE